MKKSIVTWLFLICCFFSCLSQKSSAPPAAADSSTIQQLEYSWLLAEFRLDTATIAAMMHDSFISVNGETVASKHQELEGIYRHISERQKNGHVVDTLYLQEMRVQVYGNAAIVTFISVTNGRIKDIPFTRRRTRFYDAWVKNNGQWKAVSSQGTPLP